MTKRFALGLNLSLILGLSACGLLANSAAPSFFLLDHH